MQTNLKLMCTLIFFKIITAGEIAEECSPTVNLSDGICKPVTDCEIALKYLKNNHAHPFNRCSFRGKLEIICCPMDVNNIPQTTEAINTTGPPESLRIADRECQKLINTTIPPLDLHIIGGEAASLGEFPHMVALGYETKLDIKFLCAGSLISNTFVLTAAHCVEGNPFQTPPSLARMGVTDISQNDTDIGIQSIVIHPDYKFGSTYNDLALLRLKHPVEFSANLHALCLYTEENDPTENLVVTGWGKISKKESRRNTVLMKANLEAVPRAECQKFYAPMRRLTEGISKGQICAGEPQGLRDACQGDSGGPLQASTASDGQFRLVGVTSFGRGCASPVPGVYTRVSYYLDWIESIVWPNEIPSPST